MILFMNSFGISGTICVFYVSKVVRILCFLSCFFHHLFSSASVAFRDDIVLQHFVSFLVVVPKL
jgi:hypothetical protein